MTSAAPEGHVGHIQISGENVTRGYYEDPEANAAAFTADGWLRTGDLGLIHEGDALYHRARERDHVRQRAELLPAGPGEHRAARARVSSSARSSWRACRPPDAQTDQLVVFVLHRGELEDFLPVAAEVARLINEHTGLEVAEVVPVKRIPKTTSGKIQRHVLERSYAEGEFAAELAELARLRAAQRGPAAALAHEIEETAADDLRCGARGQEDRHRRQSLRARRKLPEAHRDPRTDRPRSTPGRSTSQSCSSTRRSPSSRAISRRNS